MLSARRGSWPLFLLLALVAMPTQAQVVISQVYGGGGNAGAQYKSDFIELFNAGALPVSLGGSSVQYASSTGTSWQVTTLPNVDLQPGQYFLIKQADGTGAMPALPTPDATGTIPMSGSNGKVAFVAATTALSGACPVAADLVGFGSANCPVAPSAPTAVLSNTTAALRKTDGCTNAGNNSADFSVLAPAPRNSGSTFNLCGGGGGPPNLVINDVTLSEGDSGTKSATFTISLNKAADVGGVSFDVATMDGTATTANNDYLANGILAATIIEGAVSTTFTVTINGDTDVESDETFTVNIVNVVGANALDTVGQATIQNDDFVVVPVHAIQGNGDVSPYPINSIVATEGIVTARTSNGFFLQTPDAEADLDAGSSEGIFVFTSAAPPASAAVGNRVRINATLDEYNPGDQLPMTELKNATVIEVSTGNALPTPIELTEADANAASPVDQLERYEGMRVRIASLKITAPADGNISESSATSSGNGIFYGVLPTVGRPLREPGIDVLDPVTIPPGLNPPLFDHNPESIRVRSSGQVGATSINVDVGDTVNNLVGVLDYGFGSYTMTPDPGAGASIVLGSMPTAVSARTTDEITIGGFNLLHFFDDVADGDGAVKLTTAAYQFRLKKTANAICAYTRSPDILGVVEVEHIKALSELATSINNNQGNLLFPDSCTGNPGYQAYLVEGNDVGGIDVGFLLKTEEVAPGKPRVEVVSIDQIGKDALFTNPDASTELLNDRPPLVLVARVNAANGASQTVTVIANHLRSLIDVGTNTVGAKGWATVGDRVRAKRGAQALFLAQLIQDRQTANPGEKIVLLGDFNAFEFSDGFVDSMGIITGREAGPTEVLRYVASPITTPLTNTAEFAHAEDRYSFSFDGNAQSLDHMVVNQAVLDSFIGVRAEHARINADFGIDNYGDPTVPLRVSDHDPVVLFLSEASFKTSDLSIALSPGGDLMPTLPTAFTTTLANNGPDLASNVKVDIVLSATPTSFFATSGWPGVTCGPAVPSGAGVVVHCSIDELASGASADIGGYLLHNFPNGTVLSVGAAISSAATDPISSNNSDSADFLAVPGIDMGVRVFGPKASLAVGKLAQYQVELRNNETVNPADAGEFIVTVNLPENSFTATMLAGDPALACTPTEGDDGVGDGFPRKLTTIRCVLPPQYPAGASNRMVINLTPRFVDGGDYIRVTGNVRMAHYDPGAGNDFDVSSMMVSGHAIPPNVSPVD